MKIQWNFIFGLLFALIVAIFAIINVEPVLIDYVFGTTEIPLILIILGSALLGGLIVGSVGLFRNLKLQRKVKLLTKDKDQLQKTIEGMKRDSSFQESQDSPKE